MSRLSKLSFLFSAIAFVVLILGRIAFGGWNDFFWIPLGLFAVLFVFPFVKDAAFFKELLFLKTTRRGMSMGTMILLVMAALVMINILAIRKTKTFDFSTSGINTLSPQSVQLMKNLDSDLKLIFFYKKGAEGNEENRRAFRDLIRKYQDQSEKVKLDFVEVNERPDLANEYGVNKGSGVVFLEYKGKRNRIEKIEEQEITGALLKVTREKEKSIYYITGHGEPDLEDAKDGLGSNSLKLLLTNNRFALKTLQLNLNPKIPDDADLIIILGPTQNFFPNEIEALQNYLKAGGHALISVKTKKPTGLEKIFASLGIQIENNVIYNVVETMMGRGINPGPTMANGFSSSNPVTKVFSKNEVVVMRHPTALKKSAVIPGIVIDEIIKAPEGSLAFPELKIQGNGTPGSFVLGLAVKGKFPGADEKAKEFSIILLGDSEFASNALLYQNLNRDLLLNTASFLSGDESMVTITPKDVKVTQLRLTPTGFSLFLWAFLIPLPFAILGIAITLHVRRRFA